MSFCSKSGSSQLDVLISSILKKFVVETGVHIWLQVSLSSTIILQLSVCDGCFDYLFPVACTCHKLQCSFIVVVYRDIDFNSLAFVTHQLPIEYSRKVYAELISWCSILFYFL